MDVTGGIEALREQGLAAVEGGRLEEALAIFDRACAEAAENGQVEVRERALCNRAAVAIELRREDAGVAELREILVRNGEPGTCFLASYNIARAYELAKQYKKALFYARIAGDRATALERREWLGWSHNLLGNLLVAESEFASAQREYETALSLIPAPDEVRRAQIRLNLGYCRVVLGRPHEGLSHLFWSIRTLSRHGARRDEMLARLDLCFAYLEIGRFRLASRQGQRALALGEAMGEREAAKNALYLLGEAAHLAGDLFGARRCFSRLQQDFYPDADYLTEFLLAVDVRKLINLKA